MNTPSNQTCTNAIYTLPGRSAACGVTDMKNNTAILAACCGENIVEVYRQIRAPLCNHYCNLTTATFEESLVYECLKKAENLINWGC